MVIDSINHLLLPKSAYIENEFDSSGQKRETMAKRYTLIHAHEKNLFKFEDSGMAIAPVK